MTKENLFHLHATPIIFGYENALKKEMTEAENILWRELCDRKLDNLKFRKRHPAGKFILEFYCPELKLAVEVDENLHELENVKEKDEGRPCTPTE